MARFKIGDQVVRPIIGNGLETYQIVAIGGNMLFRRYIIGKKGQDYYINCEASELYKAPQSMELPPEKLLISMSTKKAGKIK